MVDEEIVVDKLRYINEYTNDLKQMRGISKTEYVDDVVVQRAVERTFMNLIQSCIDLSQHIRASEDFSPSGTAKKTRSSRLGMQAYSRTMCKTDGRSRRVSEYPRPPVR